MAAEQDWCPNCGAEFKLGRLACPECGSDAGTGWKSPEEIDYQSVEIPDAWPPDGASDAGRRPFGNGRQILILLVVVGLVLVLSGLIRLLG